MVGRMALVAFTLLAAVSCGDSAEPVAPIEAPAVHLRSLDFEAPYVPDQLIFALPDPRDPDQTESCFDPRRTAFLATRGAEVIREYKLIRACRIRFRRPTGPDLLNLEALEMEGHPELFGRVAPDHPARLEQGQAPNDPLYLQQWGLRDIDAQQAWLITKGSHEVRVAVVDSGIDYSHPDLANNIWENSCESVVGDGDTPCPGSSMGNWFKDDVHGYNFVDDLPDPRDTSGASHGTMVAGVIGAVTDNGLGIAGTNWSVDMLALKFTRETSGSAADAAEAIRYAVQEKAQVINASFSIEADDPFLRPAVEFAMEAGVLVVAAAATDEGEPQNIDSFGGYPCAYDLANVLCVTAIDENAELASSWGATTVDLAAPGVGIHSTFASPDYRLQGTSTSMAAPFVSGVAALIHAACPGITMSKLRAALLTGKSFTAGQGKQTVTTTRLNAKLALDAACERRNPAPGSPTLLP